jgi:transcriptional regulator with XRE-family HTH domain
MNRRGPPSAGAAAAPAQRAVAPGAPPPVRQAAQALGRWVAAYRAEHALTQAALGERLGWPQANVARLEAGHRTPQLATLARLARRLGLAVTVQVTPDGTTIPAPAAAAGPPHGATRRDDPGVLVAAREDRGFRAPAVVAPLGRALVAYRQEHGLSQEALAQRLRVGEAQILRLEQGRHTPTLDTLARLARGLRVTLLVRITPASADLAVTPVQGRSPGQRRMGSSAERQRSAHRFCLSALQQHFGGIMIIIGGAA